MITERTLRQWRKESLKNLKEIEEKPETVIDRIGFCRTLDERILRMTQELLDQHLMKGGEKK